MKTTVDIPENVMKDALRLTRAKTKRDAVVGAMQEYIRREKLAKLVKHLGKSKTFMTHKELMDMRLERGKYRSSR